MAIVEESISCGQWPGSLHISYRVCSQRDFTEGAQPPSGLLLYRTLTRTQLLVAACPPYFLCNQFVKHAWLTFYYDLSRTRGQRWFIHVMQIIAATFGFSSVFVILLQCIPLHTVWRRNLDPSAEQSSAKCIDLITFFYFNSIFMIINDVVMYLIPMALLWKVDMIRDQRCSLFALFGVCFL